MTASWDNQEKPGLEGGGWDYEENLITYDEDIDPDFGLVVRYNGLGTAQSFTNQNKS